jgi:hypothetical protein
VPLLDSGASSSNDPGDARSEFAGNFLMTPSGADPRRMLLERGRGRRAGIFDVAADSWM